MVSFRTFQNSDPPRILQLWNDSGLGRGAVRCRSTEPFEISNYAQPYFDPAGLLLAFDGPRLAGFAHGGFGTRADRQGESRSIGVVCAVVVHPEFRRRGIGRELVRRTEQHLRDRGSRQIVAGPHRYNDPFYFGLYGGSRPSGFLTSDPVAQPFFQSLGYEELERHGVFERDMTTGRDPTNVRVINIRRSTYVEVSEKPQRPSWWWFTRFGRLDTLRFRLKFKKTHEQVAGITAIGLDQYIPVWNERTIGLVDLEVPEQYRGQGYGLTLLIEMLKQLRQELVTRAEIHCPEANDAAMRAITGAGFERTDTGIVYRLGSNESFETVREEAAPGYTDTALLPP
ncbi:MAG: GNAT family N-acetyltransferase [Planctomyces sp.]|nr:GNAT family N-acetyltransferase [Planctomyces sp.]